MKKLILIPIFLILGGCGFHYDQYNKGYVKGVKPDFSFDIAGQGKVEIYYNQDGTVEHIKTEAGKPLISIGDLKPAIQNK